MVLVLRPQTEQEARRPTPPDWRDRLRQRAQERAEAAASLAAELQSDLLRWHRVRQALPRLTVRSVRGQRVRRLPRGAAFPRLARSEIAAETWDYSSSVQL